MNPVTVKIGAALICFLGQCHHVLVGADTPTGNFVLHQRRVLDAGYGGDVLQFKENARYVWAIHRVWLGTPSEHRIQRLLSDDPADRHITHGCLNVLPEVYEELKSCCSESSLTIEK